MSYIINSRQALLATLHQLVYDEDWHNLSALSTALMSGEWDTMSYAEQRQWLQELNDNLGEE